MTRRGHLFDITTVAFGDNGNTIFSTGLDGQVRVTRTRDGKACLSLAGFPSTEKGSEGEPQIIAVTPEGYYGGHPTADNLIRFNLGGYLFPAASFVDRYRRPDLIRKAFHGDETPALKATKGGIPPMAVFSFPESGASVSGEKVQVAVVATDDTGLAGVFFTVNGARIGEKPEDALGTTRDLSLLAEKIGHPIPPQHTVSRRYTANLTLPPNSGKVTIQVVVIDTDGLRSTPAELTVTRTQGRIVTERLLGLCVGVSKYKVPGLNLNFADADARELAATLDKQQSALYKERHFTTLVNEKATKSEILTELDRLIERTEKSDTVCVFLAGHGWRDERFRFYFLGSDSDPGKLEATALPWDAIVQRLTKLSEKAKRVLLFLDSCHSGVDRADGQSASTDDLVKSFLKTSAGVMIFPSSRDVEESVENVLWGHGAFTRAILDTLEIPGGTLGAKMTLWEFANTVKKRVQSLTSLRQNPQPFLLDYDQDTLMFVGRANP